MAKRVYFAALFTVALLLVVPTQAVAQSEKQQSNSGSYTTQLEKREQVSRNSALERGVPSEHNANTTQPGEQGRARLFMTAQKSSQVLSSSILGMTVQNSSGKKAKEIGTIDDLIMNKQHQLIGIVIGISGFSGIGHKSIGVSMDNVEKIKINKDVAIVSLSKEQLQNAPAFVTQPEQQNNENST